MLLLHAYPNILKLSQANVDFLNGQLHVGVNEVVQTERDAAKRFPSSFCSLRLLDEEYVIGLHVLRPLLGLRFTDA